MLKDAQHREQPKPKSSGRNQELTEITILVSVLGCVILPIPGYCSVTGYKSFTTGITRNFLVKPDLLGQTRKIW